MKQLNLFEKFPSNILQTEWMREHIKNPPPVNITEEQRQQARDKINNSRLDIQKNNF